MTTDPLPAARPRRTSWPRWQRVATAWLVLLAVGGCHDHGADKDGPAARLEPLVYTHFTDTTELFVEFRPLVTGARSTFAAHFTRLADYAPIAAGTVDVVLSGGGAPTERFRIGAPRAPGIFAPTVQPRATGTRALSLVLVADDIQVTHDLGAIEVYPTVDAARAAASPESEDGEIGYLKEQQWANGFAIEAVQPAPLRESVRAPATIRAAADRQFEHTAPVPGQVRAQGVFPALGERVERGQLLALILPRSGTTTDAASLEAERIAARSAAALARRELERVQRLLALGAVPARRLDEARAALEVADAEATAADQRHARLEGTGGGIEIRARLNGELARVDVAPGASLDEGDRLFLIVDRSELWLEAQVSETDAARLMAPSGATFELPGTDEPFELRVGNGARLVGVGRLIDPHTRSLPVIFAIAQPDPRLALNLRVDARLYTGGAHSALSVPASAVIDDGGQAVVYRMVGGESFARMPVQLGLRDGERIEIRAGLEAGQRIVVRGAGDVRRAAASPDAMGHGHAH